MPGLNYSLIVPPTVEPVSLSLAKKQVRIDIPDDDDLIQTYIEVARDYCEGYCNRAFYPQKWQLFLDHFPYGDYRSTVPMDQHSPWDYSAYWSDLAIRLPKPMATSVEAINYLDANGNPLVLDQTLYYVDVNSRPARIVPAAGTTWPMTQFYLPGSINVSFWAASFTSTIQDETVALAPAQGTTEPVLGVLANQVISITSVKDVNGNPLSYTARPVTDSNGDPTSKTQLSFDVAPTGDKAIVTYVAGVIPKSIVMAMLLIIGHLYEHREENSEIALRTMPFGVTQLLKRHKFEIFGEYGGR